MGLIMATGNYNFFNFLISIECVAILVDSDEFKFCKYSISFMLARREVYEM